VIRRHEALGRVFGLIVEDVIVQSQGLLAALAPKSVEDIRLAGRPVVQFSDGMWDNLQELRKFLFFYMEHPEFMPSDWKHASAANKVQRARSIADYIAGMTDRYALKRHKKLRKKLKKAKG